MHKVIDWNKIKTLYLKGGKPKDIGAQYGLSAKQITEKASRENWKQEKTRINNKIGQNLENDLAEISNLCTKGLRELLKRDDLKPSERIQAMRLGYDITLLNKNKKEEAEKVTGDNYEDAINAQIPELFRDEALDVKSDI